MEEWAELCGVPAADVARVGREFASTEPALLRLGVGAQRHLGAPAAYRTAACLPALTGAWRHVGGGCSYVPTATADAVQAARAPRRPAAGRGAHDQHVPARRRAHRPRARPARWPRSWCWSSNPAQVAPQQQLVLEGLRREDLFCVVLEQFMTDTAAHADVVLPATTQLEHTDALFSWGHHYLTYNEAAIAPLGEARSNSDAFRAIAARMGLDDPCFTETDEEILESLFEPEPAGMTLESCARAASPRSTWAWARRPTPSGRFFTESGKLSLDAARYEPSAEVADAELAERFPLALITPKTHLFLNSTFANAGSRQRRSQPSPYMVLHPDDAAGRGLADGERVRVWNDRGSFTCPLKVSDDARTGVAVARWDGGRRTRKEASGRRPRRLSG